MLRPTFASVDSADDRNAECEAIKSEGEEWEGQFAECEAEVAHLRALQRH
jgi:hypothetical protein